MTLATTAGKGLAGMVDARDVAAVAVVTPPAPHAGKTYWLTGPGLISNYDVADVLSGLLGRTITYRELSFDEDKSAMIRAGGPGSDRRDERPGLQRLPRTDTQDPHTRPRHKRQSGRVLTGS